MEDGPDDFQVSGFRGWWLAVPFSEIRSRDKARFMNQVRSLPFKEVMFVNFISIFSTCTAFIGQNVLFLVWIMHAKDFYKSEKQKLGSYGFLLPSPPLLSFLSFSPLNFLRPKGTWKSSPRWPSAGASEWFSDEAYN